MAPIASTQYSKIHICISICVMMFFNFTGYVALHERMTVNYEFTVAMDSFKVLL
jgi:hypothetical protein